MYARADCELGGYSGGCMRRNRHVGKEYRHRFKSTPESSNGASANMGKPPKSDGQLVPK